jgi:hypothetical protein
MVGLAKEVSKCLAHEATFTPRENISAITLVEALGTAAFTFFQVA